MIYLKDTDGTDVSLKNWHEWNNIKNHIVPKTIGFTKDNQPYYSLKEAMQHGLFSYNCRHRFIKYEPSTKVSKQYTYDPNKENASFFIDKEMRQIEETFRRAKERQTLALTPKERKKWQAKFKKLQAEYDAFCKKHNRVRNDWRTSIGVVEPGATKQISNIKNNPDGNITQKENEAPIKEVRPVVKVTANYKSAEYKSKIDSLLFSKVQTKEIYKVVRRIFINQKSEYSEGFYAIDLNNSKVKFYNGNCEANSVRRPNELLKYITENENPTLLQFIIIVVTLIQVLRIFMLMHFTKQSV